MFACMSVCNKNQHLEREKAKKGPVKSVNVAKIANKETRALLNYWTLRVGAYSRLGAC